jgi:hypothetical protein
MLKQVVVKVIEFMKTVEVEFAGKPGPEKRAALIKLGVFCCLRFLEVNAFLSDFLGIGCSCTRRCSLS